MSRETFVSRAVLAGLVLLGACTLEASPSPIVSPSPTLATPSPSPAPTRTNGASPSATEAPSGGIELPAAGRPWDAAALLAEMRASTRPDGVPSAVQTEAIAGAIADAVWTIDGSAWDTSTIGGFCGTDSCTLDLAGSHLGRAGEDLWTLRVDLATGAVEPVVAEVRSLPWELVDELDGLARSLDEADELEPMTLATARWLPPPAAPGGFILSYRSGGEEGSCSVEIHLDAEAAEIVERTATGC